MASVGPYAVVRELGRGGAGRVLLARAPDGREVAVKVLHGRGADVLARFEREARLTASLGEREGFVPVLELGTSPELGPYVVLPFCPGGTLRDRLARGPLGVEETVSLGAKLATALGRAHALGVVHRDVKPENVLFDARGEPLLADLGLARHFDRAAPGGSQSASLSKTGAFLGTAAYMPWEQVEDPRSVGPAADVYALACVLYECLAGQPPFRGATGLEVLAAVEAGRREPLRSARPDVPRAVARAIEDALGRDPAARPEDGAAFAAALGAPGEAREPRRAVAVALVALVAVALALGGLAVRDLLARRSPGPPPSTSAPTPAPSLDVAALRARLGTLETGKDWTGLEREASATLARDPRLAFAWAARARARQVRRDVPGTLADAEKALALDPDEPLALFVLGVERCKAGELRGALADLEHQVRVAPRGVGWVPLSDVKRRLGDVAGAIAAGERAVEIHPEAASAWATLAQARAVARDPRGAVRDATRGLAADPDDDLALRVRGVARISTGDFRGALEDLDRVVAAHPEDLGILGERAVTRRLTGDLRGAGADLDAFFRGAPPDHPKATSFHLERSLVRAGLGDAKGALEDAEAVLARDPRDLDGLEARATARQLGGDLAGAREDMDRAVSLSPADGKLRAVRANLLLAASAWEEAEAEATRALELAPAIVASLHVRGRARAMLGRTAEATADLEAFLARSPSGARAVEAREILAKLRGGQ